MLSDSKSKRPRQSSSDIPDVPTLPAPKGLFRCPACGEWRGVTVAKEIFRPDHPFEDEGPERAVSISCICDGIPCRRFKKNLVHRPISNQWDEHRGVGHNSYLAGMIPCKTCRSEIEKARDGGKNEDKSA